MIGGATRSSDWRARNHPAYWAFLVHRISGLLLALFLPAHFWALSRAIEGEARLESFLRWTDDPDVYELLQKADTLMVRMPDEFHGWRRPSHQLLQQLYLMAWFEKYRTQASRSTSPTLE